MKRCAGGQVTSYKLQGPHNHKKKCVGLDFRVRPLLPDFLASLAAAILKMIQHGDVRGSGGYFTDLAAGGVCVEE